MFSRDKILRETSPLSIFFVKSSSGGNRLLFRYPYDVKLDDEELSSYCDALNEPISEQDLAQLKNVIDENDEALCNMFSVNPNLCGQKFEIKINSVRHVGHPMSLLSPMSTISNNHSSSSILATSNTIQHKTAHNQHANLDLSSYDSFTAPNMSSSVQKKGDITSFNIVCALRSSASYDIVDCYHDLSKRLAIALSFEERRCSYLSKEIKTMLAALEERDMANLTDRDNQEAASGQDGLASNQNGLTECSDHKMKSVFSHILEHSNLARDLKRVFISLSTSGMVDLKINNWVSVSFCLPQKVHRWKLMTHKFMPAISTRDIKRCLMYLRPYHGLLLLCEPNELLNSLPIDASPAMIQLIKVTKPDKNFSDLSVDANLTLMQVFSLASQMIYWAKATVIYPICDSNIYAIHPLASTGIKSKLVCDFRTRFPHSKSLHHYLADFSEGTSLSQLNGPLLSVEEKLNLLSIVTWLLQRRILTQIHKYIFLVIDYKSTNGDKPTMRKLALNAHQTHDEVPRFSPREDNDMNVHHANNGVQNLRANNLKVSASMESPENSGQYLKGSLSESPFEGPLMRPHRADSLAESQEDSNYGLNSSLSSTPNSNFEYPSPSNDIVGHYSLSSSGPLNNRSDLNDSNIARATLQRAGLSPAGVKNVLAVPSSKNPDDLRLFTRLIPYFNGKHHVEDIMFFENLERSQVLILCDKFRDILFTCHYEDVAVSQSSPFDSAR